MERLLGKFCIVEYLNKSYLYEKFSLSDLNYYKEIIKDHKLIVEIDEYNDYNFCKLILKEINI